MSSLLFNRWILSLLEEETPQAREALCTTEGYCCLGDLFRVHEGEEGISRKQSIVFENDTNFIYKGEETSGNLTERFTEDYVLNNLGNALCVDKEDLVLVRDGVELNPVDLNDANVPKRIIGAFIWSFVNDGDLAESLRTKYKTIKEKLDDIDSRKSNEKEVNVCDLSDKELTAVKEEVKKNNV